MLQSELSRFGDIMELKEKLRSDLADAMRAGDVHRRDVLRFVLAAVKQAEVDGMKALDDNAVQEVLRKQIKQRQESIADYQRAGRQDDVARESSEIAIIEEYLPQMMSREEIEGIARAIITDLGVTDSKSMGQIMNRLMPQVKGRADGRLVNEVVRALLQ
jgi:uncharacterized protein YqeY